MVPQTIIHDPNLNRAVNGLIKIHRREAAGGHLVGAGTYYVFNRYGSKNRVGELAKHVVLYKMSPDGRVPEKPIGIKMPIINTDLKQTLNGAKEDLELYGRMKKRKAKECFYNAIKIGAITAGVEALLVYNVVSGGDAIHNSSLRDPDRVTPESLAATTLLTIPIVIIAAIAGGISVVDGIRAAVEHLKDLKTVKKFVVAFDAFVKKEEGTSFIAEGQTL